MASLGLNLDLIAAGDEIKFDGIKKKKILRAFLPTDHLSDLFD